MAKKKSDGLVLGATGANLIRITIASYFIAVAIGVIPGTDISALFSLILPQTAADLLARAIIFGLAFLVLLGVWLRGAALLLGIAFFWASYISMAQLGLAERIGAFWRDIALIAALIMTYAETDPRARTRRSVFRLKPKTRRLVPSKAHIAPHRVEHQPNPDNPVVRYPASRSTTGTVLPQFVRADTSEADAASDPDAVAFSSTRADTDDASEVAPSPVFRSFNKR